jgi:PHS family inorganic phosphate transporter-like MFS transporter
MQYCRPGVACKQLDDAWRVCVAVGAIPAIATWYLRSKLPETPRFTVHVAKDTAKAEADVLAVLENSDEFRQREKTVAARGTGLTWREFNEYILQRKNLLVSGLRVGLSATGQQYSTVQ